MPGVWELLIILAIALLIFGGKRLKNLGGDLGSAIKGFKNSMSSNNDNIEKKDADVIETTVVEEETKKAK